MRRGIGGKAGLVLLAGVLSLTGCQTWTEGTTLPSGHYIEHPPQAVPPSSPYSLQRELSQLSAEVAPLAAPDASASKELEEALQEHAEAMAALKVATRALEASQKRLEALAKRGAAIPSAVAPPGTPTTYPASPPVPLPAAPDGR